MGEIDVPWIASVVFRIGALMAWTIISGMLWWAQRANGPFLRALACLTTAQTFSVAYFLLFNTVSGAALDVMRRWAWSASAPLCVAGWWTIIELGRLKKRKPEVRQEQ